MAKGRFILKNPTKYIGNANNVFFRSSWELRAMQFFDMSPSILRWGSEEIKIPYIKPTDGKIHYYYPDFLIVYKDKNGQIKQELLEIKPLKEVKISKKSTLYDKVSIAINEAKWKAATAFALQNGMTFRILTEASIFKNAKPIKPKEAPI
jgi:hypothetical protein